MRYQGRSSSRVESNSNGDFDHITSCSFDLVARIGSLRYPVAADIVGLGGIRDAIPLKPLFGTFEFKLMPISGGCPEPQSDAPGATRSAWMTRVGQRGLSPHAFSIW